MKKLICLFLLLSIPTIAFAEEETIKNQNYSDGSDGVVKQYYTSGKLKQETNYKEGIEKIYYENGQLERERHFKDNKWDGIYKIYYNNGQLMREENYENAKEDGAWKIYYKNGQLKYKVIYEDNKIISSEYYPNIMSTEKLIVKAIYGSDNWTTIYYKDSKEVARRIADSSGEKIMGEIPEGLDYRDYSDWKPEDGEIEYRDSEEEFLGLVPPFKEQINKRDNE